QEAFDRVAEGMIRMVEQHRTLPQALEDVLSVAELMGNRKGDRSFLEAGLIEIREVHEGGQVEWSVHLEHVGHREGQPLAVIGNVQLDQQLLAERGWHGNMHLDPDDLPEATLLYSFLDQLEEVI